LKAKNTYVIIEKTIVMLSGKLSSLKKTNQAVEIVMKTDGVKKVAAKI
jgi:osmotically-inducible protein OsmY